MVWRNGVVVFDKTLMDAMLELEKQAARECGQWSEKVEHSGSVDLVARLAAARQRLLENSFASD